MDKEQSTIVLAKVAAIWLSQPLDDAIAAEWFEALEPVSYAGALNAVRMFRDSGRDVPPTCGQVRLEGFRAEAQARRGQRLLAEPKPDRETVRRNLHLLSEVRRKLEGKFTMTNGRGENHG